MYRHNAHFVVDSTSPPGVRVSVADLIAQARDGDPRSLATLLPLVYDELKALAASYMERQPGHTLQPTALVHEVYLKLVGTDAANPAQRSWNGREHFMATAARAMRQVLVDHARRRLAVKRGDGARRADVSIEGFEAAPRAGSTREMRVLELDELLTRLAAADERSARGAEMRLFGGMDQDQIARVLEVSRATVVTDWQFARAWLASKIEGPARA